MPYCDMAEHTGCNGYRGGAYETWFCGRECMRMNDEAPRSSERDECAYIAEEKLSELSYASPEWWAVHDVAAQIRARSAVSDDSSKEES